MKAKGTTLGGSYFSLSLNTRNEKNEKKKKKHN
jgi:hypothetical protein